MKTNVTIDGFSQEGTRALCKIISQYWENEGFMNVRVYPVFQKCATKDFKEGGFWSIRSNIGLYGPEDRKAEVM